MTDSERLDQIRYAQRSMSTKPFDEGARMYTSDVGFLLAEVERLKAENERLTQSNHRLRDRIHEMADEIAGLRAALNV